MHNNTNNNVSKNHMNDTLKYVSLKSHGSP